MIIVSLLGMDSYEAIETTKKLHALLVKAYGVKDEELEFFAPESFIIHDGVEQTNYRLNLRIEAPEAYQGKEKEVKDLIFDALRDVAVQFRILFVYFKPEHEYLHIDESYPIYMTDKNTVKVGNGEEKEEKENYEEEYEEPYMGDIIGEFDKYLKEHPNASDKEVYEALSGIREEVNSRHHEDSPKDSEGK
jgi:hypothetical protein